MLCEKKKKKSYSRKGIKYLMLKRKNHFTSKESSKEEFIITEETSNNKDFPLRFLTRETTEINNLKESSASNSK